MPHQLSPDFIAHIARIKAILDEVDPKSMEEWIEGFALDGNPSQELFVWECIASAYHAATRGRALAPEARKEVFMLAFNCSFGDAYAAEKARACVHVDTKTATEVLAQYRAAAAANAALRGAAAGKMQSSDEPGAD